MTGPSDLNCNEFVELVTAYLDGALDPETKQRVETHLAGCDGCDQYLEQIRQTIRTVGELPPSSLSPDARRTLLGAFRRRRD
ncbi:MAG TPA: zf-HC2 domain-containing protein [Actinomycetes bacterium]|nr:zf-HC2 domain-containing protein [Actinomycetes bacterium]